MAAPVRMNDARQSPRMLDEKHVLAGQVMDTLLAAFVASGSYEENAT